jgi:hypothetical protein
LIRHNEFDLRELKVKILREEPSLSNRLLNYQLSLMKEENYIEFIEKYSEEYKKCLEKYSIDKRIKNIAKYCKERYPVLIKVKITDAGRVKFIHNCYCLSYCCDKNAEVALLNMRSCEDLADIRTKPPSKCPC